jgi:4-hydroxythreonine-4-phosphate dehydrogenase
VTDFIFMLTKNDVTVPDAAERVREALNAGIGHIGFKDIGLPWTDLHHISDLIRSAQAAVYLEMVSLDAASEAASARAALELNVDVLMGGTRPDVVLPIIAGSQLRYYPFPGTVVGHPSRLIGSAREIVASAKDLSAQPGIHGLDLLAYRFDGDSSELMRGVCASVNKPVVVAGSIDRAERVREAVHCGVAAFTVGTAVFDGHFPAPPSLTDQLAFIQTSLSEALARRG